MTTQPKKTLPMFEIGFAPLREHDGKPGSIIKIAAVWAKEDANKDGGIVRYFSQKASPFSKIGKGAVFLENYRLPENPDPNKTYPLHELFYCTSKRDQYDKEYLDAGLRIATIWPPKEGKKLPIITYHLDPASPAADFGAGVAYLLEVKEKEAQPNSNQPPHDAETGEVYDTPADYNQHGPALEQI